MTITKVQEVVVLDEKYGFPCLFVHSHVYLNMHAQSGGHKNLRIQYLQIIITQYLSKIKQRNKELLTAIRLHVFVELEKRKVYKH